MKKIISIILVALILSSLTVNALAYSTEFSDGPENKNYSRTAARDYVSKYTGYIGSPNRNPDYADYTNLGGDCTNFISQMLYAGGMKMTSKVSSPGNNSWYYYGSEWGDRTSSWTAADDFRSYWGVINGSGYKHAHAMYKYTAAELKNNSAAYKNLVSRCQIGDVIQFVNQNGVTYHSMGVQRVYYENGVRKVTISQHTPDDFYRLTDKISGVSSSNWVILLKMSTNNETTRSISLNSINNFLGNETLTKITGKDNTYSSRNIQSIDTLSTDQLAVIYDELQRIDCETTELDQERWTLVDNVGNILDSRYAEMLEKYGEDIVPKTVVTKNLLIQFVQDKIADCEIIAQIPMDIDPAKIDRDAAIVSLEEENKIVTDLLKKLYPFLEEVENNATDENAYSYWQTYWNSIICEPLPTGYCER